MRPDGLTDSIYDRIRATPAGLTFEELAAEFGLTIKAVYARVFRLRITGLARVNRSTSPAIVLPGDGTPDLPKARPPAATNSDNGLALQTAWGMSIPENVRALAFAEADHFPGDDDDPFDAFDYARNHGYQQPITRGGES